LHIAKVYMLESLLLFFHIVISLITLWRGFYRKLLFYLSPLIGQIYFASSVFAIFLISQLPIESLIFKILLLYIPLILIGFLQSFIVFRWKQQLILQFEFFINYLITQIKMGVGFRSAFKKAAKALPYTSFQKIFMDILETILLAKNLRPELCFLPSKQIIGELRKADASGQCLEHLENLRHKLQVQSVFRKKAESVLLQIRLQALILVFLYSGLFIFVLYRYGLKYLNILLFSLCLFIIGLIILSHLGKKIKWTI